MKTTMTPEEITAASLQERLALAQSPDTVDEILLLLAQDKKLDVRRALTERKGLSEQLMQLLVNDKSKDIRLRMANHPELKAEFQEILAGSREVAIRVALTGRNDVSDDLLMKLAAGSNRDVGLSILDSGTLSDELLLKLAANNNRDVGLAIVKRSTLSDELKEQLITHRNADVRAALALRDDVSEDLLLKLAASNNKDVGLAILKRTKLSDELQGKLAAHRSKDVRSALAKRKALPETLIATLIDDRDTDVILAIAEREQLSVDRIKKLSTHKNDLVRTAIATRDDLPEEVIDVLAVDKSIEVLYAVAKRSNLSERLTNKMLSHGKSKMRITLAQKKSLACNVIEALAKDEDDKVRAVIAARSDITESMIDAFVKDSSANVRLAIVGRSGLPEQMSQQLSRQLINELGDIRNLLRYIEKVSNARLTIADHKLVFGNDWYESRNIVYERLGQLLALLFSHPTSSEIQEIVINADWNEGFGTFSFSQTLNALSAVKTETEVKRIILDRDDVDLSSVGSSNWSVIDKRIFPKLEYLSIVGALGRSKLDMPELKEIAITSSGDDFHECIYALMTCNLPNLEKLNISAGYYGAYYDNENYIKTQIDMKNAHTIWPNLKSLAIGARNPYDWAHLFTAPFFGQLDRLEINLDDPDAYGCYEGSDGYDEDIDECITVMYKNLVDLINALRDRPNHMSRLGNITIGIGADFINAAGGSYSNKIARLSATSNCTIQHEVFVGGYE